MRRTSAEAVLVSSRVNASSGSGCASSISDFRHKPAMAGGSSTASTTMAGSYAASGSSNQVNQERVMNCPKCNTSVPANARFCGGCGQQIEVAASSQTPAMLGAHATAAAGGATA